MWIDETKLDLFRGNGSAINLENENIYVEIKHLAHHKAWCRFNNALRVFFLLRYRETSAQRSKMDSSDQNIRAFRKIILCNLRES